jgi:hypothetical protein
VEKPRDSFSGVWLYFLTGPQAICCSGFDRSCPGVGDESRFPFPAHHVRALFCFCRRDRLLAALGRSSCLPSEPCLAPNDLCPGRPDESDA